MAIERRDHSAIETDCALAATESLDVGICVCSADLSEAYYANRAFIRLAQWQGMRLSTLPALLADRAVDYVAARRALGYLPPAMRLERADETSLYLRVLPAPQQRYEVVVVREELLRDPGLFRELQARFGITHREFQIMAGLRLGKTNRLLARDLGLSEHRIEKLVSRLLERFGLSNRTQLAQHIEHIASRRI